VPGDRTMVSQLASLFPLVRIITIDNRLWVEFIISQVFKLPGGSDIVTNDHYYFHTFCFVSILQDTQQIYK